MISDSLAWVLPTGLACDRLDHDDILDRERSLINKEIRGACMLTRAGITTLSSKAQSLI